MALITRSVWVSRGRSKYECTAARTMSSLAKQESGKSRLPSFRISTSMPLRIVKLRNLPIDAVDFARLLADASRIEAVGHGDAAAVVGQREVLIALGLRGLGHSLD